VQKGIIFTIMALVLIATIATLYMSEKEVEKGRREALIKNSSFNKVSSKYSDIKQSMLSLPLAGKEKENAERILPFNYGVDGNSFWVGFDLPDSSNKTQTYLETLNAAKIFLDNEWRSEGVAINASFPLPYSWGATNSSVSFLVMPQCMKFLLKDENNVSFEFKCQDYEISNAKKIDINISLKPGLDFNSMDCKINDYLSCNQNYDYNSYDNRPYINIKFLDQNCTSCFIPYKKIRTHFDPSEENFLELKCSGANCKNPPMDINFSNSIEISYSGKKIEVKYNIDFNSKITEFLLGDANFSATDVYFGARRWNN
jgi:hypothetical protein